MDVNKTRITVSITDELAKKFTELTRQIGVSGTALLSRALPVELNYLAELPGNSESAKFALGLVLKCELGRLNFTLNRQDVERMDRICSAKRIPRNTFIRHYIDFLVNGDRDVCEGPLTRVNEILANPRHEYEESCQRKKPEDRHNPYYSLHLDEETVDEVIAIIGEVS